MPHGTPLRRIGVVGYPRYPTLGSTLERVARYCAEAQLELYLEPELLSALDAGHPLTAELLPELDLLLTVGGDGTLLRGARLVVPHAIPVLGINLGRLGFLTSISPEELDAGFAAVLAGEAEMDERMVLRVEAVAGTGKKHGEYVAVNDVVLHRGGVARMIRMKVHAHGEEVGTYSADGIILATPTGSTAYSLSAGGPIIPPALDCIIATPICPHTLAVRPLVLSPSETVTVEVLSPTEELILTIDGQQAASLLPGDSLVVCRGDTPLRLVRLPGQTFFSTLRRKLAWGDLGERDR
jgi:NAD+ kinase